MTEPMEAIKAFPNLPESIFKLTPDSPVVLQLHEAEEAWQKAETVWMETGCDLAKLNQLLAEMFVQLRDAKRTQAEADWQAWRAGTALPKSGLAPVAERFTRLTAVNEYLGTARIAANRAANLATADLLDARATAVDAVVSLWYGMLTQRVSAAIGTMVGMDNFDVRPKSREIENLNTLRDRLRQAARAIREKPDAPYSGELPLDFQWREAFPAPKEGE